MKERSYPSEPHSGGWGGSTAKPVPAQAGRGNLGPSNRHPCEGRDPGLFPQKLETRTKIILIQISLDSRFRGNDMGRRLDSCTYLHGKETGFLHLPAREQDWIPAPACTGTRLDSCTCLRGNKAGFLLPAYAGTGSAGMTVGIGNEPDLGRIILGMDETILRQNAYEAIILFLFSRPRSFDS